MPRRGTRSACVAVGCSSACDGRAVDDSVPQTTDHWFFCLLSVFAGMARTRIETSLGQQCAVHAWLWAAARATV